MPATRTPAQILTDAINDAHRQGITVDTGRRPGVTCTSTLAPRWERNPRAETVSALGAVLLAEQPPVPLYDDALVHVFGSKMLYHLGIEDGVMHNLPSENLQKGPDAQLYRDGHKLGSQVRVLLSTERCEPHRTRHPRGERCPKCRAGVPVLRAVEDERTAPIVPDAEV